MRHLVRKSGIPHKPAMIACSVQRIGKQPVVRLVFCAHVCPHFAIQRRGRPMQNQHTRHRIRTIHQRGWTLQNLHGTDILSVHFHTVFIAPLLSLLAHTLMHHDDAVIAQATNDGLRDASTCGDLRHAWLLRHSVNHICRCRLSQLLPGHHRDGRCRVLQLRVARHTRHHHFIQLQVAIEHIRAVGHLISTVIHTMVLCCHCRTIAQQRQDYISCLHFFLHFKINTPLIVNYQLILGGALKKTKLLSLETTLCFSGHRGAICIKSFATNTTTDATRKGNVRNWHNTQSNAQNV